MCFLNTTKLTWSKSKIGYTRFHHLPLSTSFVKFQERKKRKTFYVNLLYTVMYCVLRSVFLITINGQIPYNISFLFSLITSRPFYSCAILNHKNVKSLSHSYIDWYLKVCEVSFVLPQKINNGITIWFSLRTEFIIMKRISSVWIWHEIVSNSRFTKVDLNSSDSV